MNLTVDFAGGLEYLFGGCKNISLVVPDSSCIQDLISILVKNHLQERKELFVLEETVRPGILVLRNNIDWELENGLATKLSEHDSVTFISTLHGG